MFIYRVIRRSPCGVKPGVNIAPVISKMTEKKKRKDRNCLQKPENAARYVLTTLLLHDAGPHPDHLT